MNTKQYETPFDWFVHFAQYIVAPHEFDYGDFVIIDDSAPESAKEYYRAYISLARKYLQTRDDLVVVKNRRIVGINPNANGKEREQGEIVLKLISLGYINNDPFLK